MTGAASLLAESWTASEAGFAILLRLGHLALVYTLAGIFIFARLFALYVAMRITWALILRLKNGKQPQSSDAPVYSIARNKLD